MKRIEKLKHQVVLSRKDAGKVQEQYASPKLRKAAGADKRMTVADYTSLRMGRGQAANGATTARKLTKMGYEPTERGGFKKVTRKI